SASCAKPSGKAPSSCPKGLTWSSSFGPVLLSSDFRTSRPPSSAPGLVCEKLWPNSEGRIRPASCPRTRTGQRERPHNAPFLRAFLGAIGDGRPARPDPSLPADPLASARPLVPIRAELLSLRGHLPLDARAAPR